MGVGGVGGCGWIDSTEVREWVYMYICVWVC